MRQKNVTPRWVDKLLVVLVISVAKFLLRYSESDVVKHYASFFLGYFSDLMADLFPVKGKASKRHPGKGNSL